MKTVDVLLTGQVVQGMDVHGSAADLARLAGIDQRTAMLMLSSGRLIRIKKGVEATTGLQYFRVLRAIGVDVLLRPAEETPAGRPFFPAAQTLQGRGVERSNPKSPGKTTAARNQINETGQTIQAGHTLTAPPRLGPGYQPQQAVPLTPMLMPMVSPVKSRAGLLHEVRASLRAFSAGLPSFSLRRDNRGVAIALPHGPKSRRSEEWLSTPRLLPARQGWEWLYQAWMQFSEELGLWLLCFFLCCAMLGLLFWIPAVHIFLMVMALPVLLGAMMLIAHRRHLEEPLGSLQPLAATLQRGQGLLLLGFLSLLFLLFLGAVFFFAADFGLLQAGLFTWPGLQIPNPAQMQAMAAAAALFLFLLLMLVGYLFAIPLILFARLRALHGFQMAVFGCIKNWRPMLIALTISASAVSSALALLLALQQFLPWLPGFVYAVLIAVASILVFMMGILFIYLAFRDMFALSP
ncbi:MAG: hypothetical protein Q4G66_03880 [bacterium]|nr:hypothetical protein [bacterium]